jgi:hypothetical protein
MNKRFFPFRRSVLWPLVALAVAATVPGGCGRSVSRTMGYIGLGPTGVSEERLDQRPAEDVSYITMDPVEEPREVSLTAERAEDVKKDMDAVAKRSDEEGVKAAREGAELLRQSSPQ